MNKVDFDQLVATARSEHPIWFELERDGPADEAAIRIAEATLGVGFPVEYRDFLLSYGGGYFAFAVVLGVLAGSTWHVRVMRSSHADSFLAVSDTGTGDYYGYSFDQDGKCGKTIAFFDHETATVTADVFSDLYEMLARRGLCQR